MTRRYPHVMAGSLCGGLALAVPLRLPFLALPLFAAALLAAAAGVEPALRLPLVALALLVGGWWWGSARLDALDRSPLSRLLGTAETAQVVVTAPPRPSRFDIRVQGELHRFGALRVTEPVLLELPAGRSPAQGDVLEALGVLAAPHGPERGFDERLWLRRHGIHVVLRVDRWRVTGRRGGLGGVADRLRALDLLGLLARAVPHDRLVPRLGDVPGDRSAHDACTEDRRRLRLRVLNLTLGVRLWLRS